MNILKYFVSYYINESKFSLGFGAAFPIVFLLMNMLAGASKDAEILRNISIYGWYDPVELVRGSEVLGLNLLFIGIIIVLFTASVIVFKGKRLPL